MNLECVAARRAATPRADERPDWRWPPEGVEWEGKPAATPMKMRPVRPCLPSTTAPHLKFPAYGFGSFMVLFLFLAKNCVHF